MPTYRLTIEYEGTRYSGWQAQGNTPKTIQGHLMRAASQVAGDVDVGGAGRTDAAARLVGRHDFSAFTDKRLQEDESRVVVVGRSEVAVADDLILFRIEASHFLWKMVRKLVAFLAEVGRGEMTADDLGARLHRKAPAFQPSAPPSGLFLEAILYRDETFARPLLPIVPVETR